MSSPKDPIKYQEYIKRQSESHKGKKQTEEDKKKKSIAHLGQNKGGKLSIEHRRKLSVSHRGLISGMKNKKHTEFAKRKNRESHLGKRYSNRKSPPPFTEEHRKMSSYNLNRTMVE